MTAIAGMIRYVFCMHLLLRNTGRQRRTFHDTSMPFSEGPLLGLECPGRRRPCKSLSRENALLPTRASEERAKRINWIPQPARVTLGYDSCVRRTGTWYMDVKRRQSLRPAVFAHYFEYLPSDVGLEQTECGALAFPVTRQSVYELLRAAAVHS